MVFCCDIMTPVAIADALVFIMYIAYRLISSAVLTYLVFKRYDPYRLPEQRSSKRFLNPVNYAAFLWLFVFFGLNICLILLTVSFLTDIASGDFPVNLLYNQYPVEINTFLTATTDVAIYVGSLILCEIVIKLAEFVLLTMFVVTRKISVRTEQLMWKKD